MSENIKSKKAKLYFSDRLVSYYASVSVYVCVCVLAWRIKKKEPREKDVQRCPILNWPIWSDLVRHFKVAYGKAQTENCKKCKIWASIESIQN